MAGNGLFSGKGQLPTSSSTSWDVAWEARAEVWQEGVRAPGNLIINGLRANPGEVFAWEEHIPAGWLGGRRRQWMGFNQVQGCPTALVLRVLTLSLQIKHIEVGNPIILTTSTPGHQALKQGQFRSLVSIFWNSLGQGNEVWERNFRLTIQPQTRLQTR